MAVTKGTAIDGNHYWRFNYPADGFLFDLRKRRFAFYKDGDYSDEELARKLVLDLMFFPKSIENLDWKPEELLMNPDFNK